MDRNDYMRILESLLYLCQNSAENQQLSVDIYADMFELIHVLINKITG